MEINKIEGRKQQRKINEIKTNSVKLVKLISIQLIQPQKEITDIRSERGDINIQPIDITRIIR